MPRFSTLFRVELIETGLIHHPVSNSLVCFSTLFRVELIETGIPVDLSPQKLYQAECDYLT